MEIEAKFRVMQRDVFDTLLHMRAIGEFMLHPAATVERQINTYLDTRDRRLAVAGLSMRIREVGARRVVTIKQSLLPVDGLYRREEWDVAVEAGIHLGDWPSHPIRERLLAILSDQELEPQFRIYTRRHTIGAINHVPVAEICLDEGHMSAGGRVIGFRELEVELKNDAAQPEFKRLIDLLRRRFPLLPENRSKRSRGLWLLERASNLSTPMLNARVAAR